tara:strand:+ start:4112 stop:4516 length:405 start_codon:yes stop_codon:yes gene_type:complete
MKGKDPKDCCFCKELANNDPSIYFQDTYFFAKWDPAPKRLGHTLIIPKMHIGSILWLTPQIEQLLPLFRQQVLHIIEHNYLPDAYIIGSNNGEAAGQSLFHAHEHIIPQYNDDPAPRGGLRNFDSVYVPPVVPD